MKLELKLKKDFLLWLGIAIISLPIIIITSYHVAYRNRIYPGVIISGQEMGNQTISKATTMIESQLKTNQQNQIEVFLKEEAWPLDLQLEYDASQTAQKAYQIGRDQNFFQNLITKTKLWFSNQEIGFSYHLDHEQLESQIELISNQIFIPAIEPTINLQPNPGQISTITIESGQDGQELDKQKFLDQLDSQLGLLDFSVLELPLHLITPRLSDEEMETTRLRAKKFLGKKLVFVGKNNSWSLNEKELIDFLSFETSFDQEKIATWSASLAESIDRSPENAAFKFQDGRVIEFRPAQEGLNLDQSKTIVLLTESLAKLETGSHEITNKLPISHQSPEITIDEVNNLGIKESVGQGVSSFRGSSASRLHNIQLASSKLNGLLIKPDEVFSFNEQLGETSLATGFQQAYIIKEGRTILGDGGGVCQVSTTLFRAALDAGLPIIERQAHAYRVSYYEQNYQPGFDATVFEPSPDLKFKNDTPAHLLIQTKFNRQQSQLIFELYGTSDGRTSSLSKAKTWDQKAPPADLYIDDPNLPAGQIKQIEKKIWGAKVSFDYKVIRGNEVLQNRTFYSTYQPWQAIYLRGIN